MKRKILFRGKRCDNGEWETGSLVIVRMGCHDEQCFIADKMTGYHTPIDSSTIGQYTSLKDKTGKRIFEGDVFDWGYAGVYDRRYVVAYDAQIASFVGERGGGFVSLSGIEIKIIGNIHDKPELLEVEE